VLEAAPDAMLVVNRAGEIVTANLQAQKFYGCSREDLIGSVVESLIPARLRDRHRRHRENFFANPKTQTIQVLEIFAVRRDVSEVPVDVSLSQLTIGAETFAISAIRDATERRRIEGLKVSAERRGRLVQNSSVAMVVTHGLEHKVELLNDKFTALLGYTIDDIPDVAHWWPLAYSDEAYRQAVRSEWETRTEKTLRDGTPFAPMEVTVRCKDGCTRHLEVHLSTMAGDTNLVTFIDLTERKAAEEALRESEEQFRTLAEAIPQLCWMAHGDGHIFWYNQRWYTYTGTTPEQMEGWGWQSVHDPQVLPLVLERWKTSIATGDSFDMVFPLRAADGVFHPFLTRVTPVKDSEGRVARWFGTNTDVTELRNAQEALLEMS
jgi:PAS domain S-box-containing protein